MWRSLILENAVLIGVMGGLFVAQAFIGLPIPGRLRLPINIIVAVLPAILWFFLSVVPERAYPQPRQRLVAVAIIAALVARAIGEPLVYDVLRIREWLPLASALNRIVGYTFTVGIVECGLCYIIIRALTWPEHLRTRFDVVAYGAAAAIGYTTVGNVEFATAGFAQSYVVALNTFANVSILTLTLIFVGYGMAGTMFDGANVLLQPVTLAIAALVTGAVLPLRSGFLNASFGLGGTSLPRYIFGIGFVTGVFVSGIFVLTFLFRFAERQARERDADEEF